MSLLGHSRHNRRCPKSSFVRFTPLATVFGMRPKGREVPLATLRAWFAMTDEVAS
jgi:hypothetical protein